MEEGSLRVDANVSVRPRGETKLGTKTEVKNMNSFSASSARSRRSSRASAPCSTGGKVEQQTMLWDGARERCVRAGPRREVTTIGDRCACGYPMVPALQVFDDLDAKIRVVLDDQDVHFRIPAIRVLVVEGFPDPSCF